MKKCVKSLGTYFQGARCDPQVFINQNLPEIIENTVFDESYET